MNNQPNITLTDEERTQAYAQRKMINDALGQVLHNQMSEQWLLSANISGVMLEILIILNPQMTDDDIVETLARQVAGARAHIAAGGSPFSVVLVDQNSVH